MAPAKRVTPRRSSPGWHDHRRERAILVGLDGWAGASAPVSRDVIVTGTSDDIVEGGPGDDRIDAGDGNDYVADGPGSDVVRGGPGNDQFPSSAVARTRSTAA